MWQRKNLQCSALLEEVQSFLEMVLLLPEVEDHAWKKRISLESFSSEHTTAGMVDFLFRLISLVCIARLLVLGILWTWGFICFLICIDCSSYWIIYPPSSLGGHWTLNSMCYYYYMYDLYIPYI